MTVRHDDVSEKDVDSRLRSFQRNFKMVKNFFLTTTTTEGLPFAETKPVKSNHTPPQEILGLYSL